MFFTLNKHEAIILSEMQLFICLFRQMFFFSLKNVLDINWVQQIPLNVSFILTLCNKLHVKFTYK